MIADGVVLEGTGGVWKVRTTDGAEFLTSMRGRLKQEEKIKLAVGDHVTIEQDDTGDSWAITTIKERTSRLARRAPGGRYAERVIVANLDQVVVVFAAANDLAVRLVVNKCELTDPSVVDTLMKPYADAGYEIHRTSVKTGQGIAELHDMLAGRVSALTGPSGVGKSSLLNAIFPGVNLRVGEISESVNKGRHTTVGAKLVPLPENGFVVDTPGLREVGLWGISSDDVDQCFPEIRERIGTCRFRDCVHDGEPGCAIREAVAAGEISSARHQSYLKLREELAESENVY